MVKKMSRPETRDAFLPTSIFIASDKNISFNPTNNTIEIDIDEVGPFNVVEFATITIRETLFH